LSQIKAKLRNGDLMSKVFKKPDLLELRVAKGWSQQQAANRAGISRSYYGMLEIKGRSPSVEVAKKLAEIFQFSWHVFFDQTEETNITKERD
jgi:transcriptional regulator with XRE-family HTH domain